MTKKLTGTLPYQTPLNADLGTMAYQDADSVRVGSLISDGSVEIGGTGTSIYANREDSDGEIIQFRKDGTTVGSIGTKYDAGIYVGSNHSGFLFNNSVDKYVQPYSVGSNSLTSGELTLGSAGYRFKDLYLSGGVYLGGTVAANHLDDYEEGTFTLTLGGVAGGAFGLGKYVKVGRLVHFQWYSSGSFTATASSASFTGLPFITAPNSYYSVFYAYHNTYCGTASGGYLDTNAYSGVFTNNGSTTGASANATSGLYLMLAGTYYTDQ